MPTPRYANQYTYEIHDVSLGSNGAVVQMDDDQRPYPFWAKAVDFIITGAQSSGLATVIVSVGTNAPNYNNIATKTLVGAQTIGRSFAIDLLDLLGEEIDALPIYSVLKAKVTVVINGGGTCDVAIRGFEGPEG